MILFDLPLICTLLALSPTYNYYYTDDVNSDCVVRLMMFLEDKECEENSLNCYLKTTAEYTEIPKRKRPIPYTLGGYLLRRKLLNKRKPNKKRRWS